MVSNPVDNEFDGTEDVSTSFIIFELCFAQLHHFPDQFEVWSGDGLEFKVIAIIGLVVSEEGEAHFVSSIIEYFLLECEFEALHGDFESGSIFREWLVHGGASIDGHHDRIFGHFNFIFKIPLKHIFIIMQFHWLPALPQSQPFSTKIH